MSHYRTEQKYFSPGTICTGAFRPRLINYTSLLITDSDANVTGDDENLDIRHF